MCQVTERQMPAGGPAFDDGFALAGEGEIGEDFNMGHYKDTFLFEQDARLAAVDALLLIVERTPPGFRSLRSEEITPVATPWPEFLVHCLLADNVQVLPANDGTWWVGELLVCARPIFGMQAEPGWMRWFLASTDGIVRETGKNAAWISRSPSGAWYWGLPGGKNVDCMKLGKIFGRSVDWQAKVAV